MNKAVFHDVNGCVVIVVVVFFNSVMIHRFCLQNKIINYNTTTTDFYHHRLVPEAGFFNICGWLSQKFGSNAASRIFFSAG